MVDWDSYERRFLGAARKESARRRFDEGYADRCLRYARALHENGVPIIYDQTHFAHLVGYSLDYVLGAANAPRRFYRRFEISKKSGAKRIIREPLPGLKDIQRWILTEILETIQVHRFAKGFVRGRTLRDNARYHLNQPTLLKVDVRDFFGSIRFHRVRSVFSQLGYSPEVATLMARLCTFGDGLPQGAPTSPCISNIVSVHMDQRISQFAVKNKIRYTRYADDLTFSGDFEPGRLISLVKTVLSDDGLALNDSKTRIMERHQRQIATGVVLNARMNAPREVRRELRKIAYFVERFGLDAHLHHTQNHRARFIQHALGVASHVLFLNPQDRDALRIREVLSPFLHMAE